MNCSNCGTFNQGGSKFCVKCGQQLINNVVESPVLNQNMGNQFSGIEVNYSQNANMQNTNVMMNQGNVAPVNYQQGVAVNNVKTNQSVNVPFMGFFFMIIAILLKPFTSLKEEINKFNGFKNSAILSLIVAGTSTIINLLTTMWSVVRVKSYNWSTGNYTTSWVWDNLKNIKYIEVVGKNFLIYIGAITAIALVYYLGSLIAKKQSSFSRMFGISALAVCPLLISYLVVSPLLSLIWAELSIPVILIGAIYTIIIIYEGMNTEIALEGNAKYYLNLICLSILGIAMYYLYMNLFINSITSGLDGLEDIMNMFG